MSEREPSDFTIKEILTEFVLPRLDKIDKKTDKLERWQNKILGAIGFIVVVLGPLAALVAARTV